MIIRLPRWAVVLAVLAATTLGGCRYLWPREETSSRRRPHEERFEEAYRMVLKGQYEEATDRLAALAKDTSAGNGRRPDAMFWLGYAYGERGLDLEATAWYRRLIREYPKSRYVPQARHRLEGLGPAG